MTWKPVNPCTPDCKGRDSYCPPGNRFGCEDFKIYQGKIDTARQLLEYLLANMGVGTGMLKSMLKELEGK